MKSALQLLLLFVALSMTFAPAKAAMVDWDTLTWAPGTNSNSFEVDAGNPGSDVSFSVTGSSNALTNDKTSGVDTPAITMSVTGGLSPVENALELAANLKTTTKITLTANFSAGYTKGVAYVSFTIFDIDAEGNKDIIKNIYGIGVDGSKVAANITLGPAVNRTGNGLGQTLTGTVNVPDSGPNSGNGNAVISFGATPITGFAFTWTNNNGAPIYQNIAISDVSFTPVPEANAGWVGLLICGAAILARSVGGRASVRAGNAGCAATT